MKKITLVLAGIFILTAGCSTRPNINETAIILKDSVVRNQIYDVIISDSIYFRELGKQIASNKHHLNHGDSKALMKALCMDSTMKGKMDEMLKKDSSSCKMMGAGMKEEKKSDAKNTVPHKH